jgi:hypothetical protein
MSDAIGRLALPFTLPEMGDPELPDLDQAIGDPALATLTSFLKAVLTADLGDAWARMAPATPKIVNKAYCHDPRTAYFSPDKHPAIYVYRRGTKEPEQLAEDLYQLNGDFVVEWFMPEASTQARKAQREPFSRAVTTCIGSALKAKRHKAWVLPSDLDIPRGLVLATATQLATVTFTGAGLTGTNLLPKDPAREVIVTTAHSVGAYETTLPFTITGTDKEDNPLVDTLYLGEEDGGEIASTVWRFKTVSSIVCPPMLTTSGTITIGWATSSAADLGSLLMDQAGFARVWMSRTGELKTVAMRLMEPSPSNGAIVQGPPRYFRAVELLITTEELLQRDPLTNGFVTASSSVLNNPPPQAPNTPQIIGTTIDYLFEDGSLNESDYP